MVRAHPTDALVFGVVVVSVTLMAIFESLAQPSGRCIIPFVVPTQSCSFVRLFH